jgi:hypothetical protein
MQQPAPRPHAAGWLCCWVVMLLGGYAAAGYAAYMSLLSERGEALETRLRRVSGQWPGVRM